MAEKILILKHKGVDVDINDDIKEWIAYEKSTLGVDISVVIQEVDEDFDLSHKSFQVSRLEGETTELYGLATIKDQLRKLNIVPRWQFNYVFFVYDKADSPAAEKANSALYDNIRHWAYFNPLFEGTGFSEIMTKTGWSRKDPFRVFSHEVRHLRVYRLRRLGYAIADVMDATPTAEGIQPYYKEFEPYAATGNRATQNVLLRPFLNVLTSFPEKQKLMDILNKILARLLELAKGQKDIVKDNLSFTRWAEAIKQHEGWFVGSRSYRNSNPGNFRFTPYIQSLGAIGKDDGNYAIFKSYDAGWEALLQFLRDAQANQLYAYRNYAKSKGHDIPTLQDFFHVYAPSSDNNDPDHYAKVVAKAIGNGVTIYTPINEI